MNTSLKPLPDQASPSSSLTSVPRWRRLLPLLVVIPSIGLILSGFITWFNVGWVDDFGVRWMRAFVTALPVMPLGLFTMMALDRALSPLMSAWPRTVAKIGLAFCTAVVMELLMASVVTYSNIGLGEGFAAQWAVAFIKSLPIGMVIGLTMSFLIKPRLERWTMAA